MAAFGNIPFEPDRDPAHQARLRKTARKRKRPREDMFDRELADLPEGARWRIWMGRVEAVIFASPHPVTRETLAPISPPISSKKSARPRRSRCSTKHQHL
jgi:hypothetical protein